MTNLRVKGMLAVVALIMTGPSVIASAPQATRASAAQIAKEMNTLVADAKSAMLTDPTRTVRDAAQAEQLAAQMNGHRRLVGIATARWLRGEGYLRLNQLVKATPLIDSAIKLIRQTGAPTKLYGDLLLSRGGISTATTKVAAALSDYQMAHDIFRDIGDVRGRAISISNIALLYQEAEDYNNALKYYRQALDIYDVDPQLLYVIYNNRANALIEVGRVAEGEAQLLKALDIARAQKSPAMEVRVLSNIARRQLAGGRLAAADHTIAQGVSITRGADAAVARRQFWVLSANAAFRRGQFSEAVGRINRVFADVDPTSTALEMREGHRTAYEIFRKVGNAQQALVHLEALKRLDDQTSKLAASANTSLAAARFDYANQELRIAKLKADDLQRSIDYERVRARTRQNVLIGIAAIVLLIVAMLAFGIMALRRSRDEVRLANVDLATTNSALAKALAAKTEFLATTSHEIRTPLNGILGMTQVMLADGALSEEIRERIGIVHGAGISMRSLVDDILDVAKMETGNLAIEQAPFDLRATLTDVSRLWGEQARARGIAFVSDVSGSPTWIEGDAARLKQIVFNLLSNALKFTARGSVTLRADTLDGRLRIAVSDSGIGIPAEKHDIIFESFRQVDAGTTRQFGGTGLGLAICRNLALAMGGDVRVDSREGEGATFTLDLPLVTAVAPATPIAIADRKNALLIVDRSPIMRSMLRALLEDRAGTVLFAATVAEAVELIGHGGIAKVLIDDATIKGVTAEEGLARIAQAAQSVGAATILLWAGLDDAQRVVLDRTGVQRIVTKPISGDALANILYPGAIMRSDDLVSRVA